MPIREMSFIYKTFFRNLKAREIGELGFSLVHMHAAIFGAAMQTRDSLAGIQQTFLIERGFDAVKAFALVVGKLRAHLVDFFDADTVFAGDGAADFDAQFQNIRREFFGLFQIAFFGAIEQN